MLKLNINSQQPYSSPPCAPPSPLCSTYPTPPPSAPPILMCSTYPDPPMPPLSDPPASSSFSSPPSYSSRWHFPRRIQQFLTGFKEFLWVTKLLLKAKPEWFVFRQRNRDPDTIPEPKKKKKRS